MVLKGEKWKTYLNKWNKRWMTMVLVVRYNSPNVVTLTMDKGSKNTHKKGDKKWIAFGCFGSTIGYC